MTWHYIEGKMNRLKYRDISEKNLILSAKKLNQTKNPNHTAKMTQEAIVWPNQPPNLNAIENAWRIIKLQVHQRDPPNLENSDDLARGIA